jgi:hypothetical protein
MEEKELYRAKREWGMGARKICRAERDEGRS